MRKVAWILLALAFSLPVAARAERPSLRGPHFEFTGSFVHMSENGAEIQFAGLVPPLVDRAFEVGPRVGVLRIWGAPVERTDYSLGAETQLWLLNLAGPGFAVDWMNSSVGGGTTYRLEPYGTLRLMHLFKEGALAGRIGALYDGHYRWGLRVGVVIELDGVPAAAGE